jgi:4-alpha-glucanotransferase
MLGRLRAAGVLLPVFSLPSRFGIGDLGPAARRFVRLCAQSGFRYWQLLPWGPTSLQLDNSPYAALSAFAGNPLWISPEELYAIGLLRRHELLWLQPAEPSIDYPRVVAERSQLLERCYERFRTRHELQAAFEQFALQQQWWLEPWALFATIAEQVGSAHWSSWDPELRQRHPEALRRIAHRWRHRVEFHRWVQFEFFRQWEQLHQYCRAHGIALIGDLALFLAHSSADVWYWSEGFLLDAAGNPTLVAGAPPDAFAPRGQRWGHPLYNWEWHLATRFQWWCRRVAHALVMVELLRLDHFRGYAACWAVPVHAPDASVGSWLATPGDALLSALVHYCGCLPAIAEDLGTITPDVELLRIRWRLPGSRVLLFAFPAPQSSPHAPHNVEPESVLYTSVHDTAPLRAWFESAEPELRASVARYVGKPLRVSTVHWELLRFACASAAWLLIVPVQDLCGCTGRINVPGTPHMNWRWRLPPNLPTRRQWERAAELLALYGRAASEPVPQPRHAT